MAVDRSVNQQLAGLAQQFLSAYHSSLATQNVPQLSSLYGHDSVFCLDGQTAQGADISAQVIAPRLAPGPIRVKVSKTDVQQAKGTGQVLIFVTGEADARPPGRFSQVLVLQQSPSGGFYLRADIQRFGVGALAHNLAKDPSGMAGQFLQFYYQTLATNKAALPQCFRDQSEMSFEGEHYRGLKEITAKATGIDGVRALADGVRQVATLDAIALGSGTAATSAVIALVTGTITLSGETNSLSFAQLFVLLNDPSLGSFCADDCFQLNYG